MAVYYVDKNNGSDTNDGLTPKRALKNYKQIHLTSGDTVLFCRGSFYREMLCICGGEQNAPITYGAYGEGEAPTFCGSTDVSKESDWEQTERENVWRLTKKISGDVGNFVFNGNDCQATFRWTRDELSGQGDFFDARASESEQHIKNGSAEEVLLFSAVNPARFYSHIECVSFNTRVMGLLCSNIVIDGIRVLNSGVHGFAGSGDNIVIRNCIFENIGGCGWSRELRIRFGNGVELWERGNNVLIENCRFKNIYDSCVTHQGPGERTEPAKNFVCRNNEFDTYGMAAFEYRDKMPISSFFEGNVCKNAGCGFAMLGEGLPRRSEIYPRPMGHHIFLWRMPEPTEGGSLYIRNNVFGEAPVGAAIYSVISAAAEAQMTLENNKYTRNEKLLVHFAYEDFTELELYKHKTKKDSKSTYLT